MFVNPGFEGLKIVSARKDRGRVEVIGTNVLANEVFRHFSNLIAKVLGIRETRATRKARFGGE